MSNNATLTELNRFINIHEQLYLQTLNLLKDVDAEKYTNTPIDNDVMFLGSRVNKINISALIRHFVLAEVHWFKVMKEGTEDIVIPKPNNASILEFIEDGEPLLEEYSKVFNEGKKLLESYTLEDINKKVKFIDREYTVMGFLWIVFGHHSYHLGQVDMLIRQQGIYPVEYMEWPKIDNIIA